MLRLELLGWDTYPMILSGRVTSAADFASTFTEELMKGRYPLGHFYRPVTQLAFAFDYALWGLQPFGYHLTDLAILIASGVLALLVGLHLFGSGLLGATLVGLAWVLHPVHFEILAAPPRRADSLAVLFTLIALRVQPGPGEQRAPWRCLFVATCCLFAVGAKETGAVAAGLVFFRALASAEQRRWTTRGLQALRATWLPLAFVLVFIALRTAVLGGLGGNPRTTLVGGLARAPHVALQYAQAVFCPRGLFGQYGTGALSVGLAAAGLVSLSFLLAQRRRGLEPGSVLSLRRGAALLGAWFTMLAIVTGMSGLTHGWYALPFLPVYCLLLGLIAGHGLAVLTSGRRVLGACALLAAFGLFSLNAYCSGLFEGAPEFSAASRLSREFLERFEAEVRAAPPGARLRLGGYPPGLRVQRYRAPTDTIHILAPYSLEAYAELRVPERIVRVKALEAKSDEANGLGDVLVVVVPGPARDCR